MAADLIGVRQHRVFSASFAPGSPAGPRPDRSRCCGRVLVAAPGVSVPSPFFDQLFHVLGVGVVIFGGIEFCRHALDQLQGKIDFVGDQLLVDRQAELVSRADFRGETEGG